MLAADPRYRALPLALRGALFDLHLAARPDGSIPLSGTPDDAARALWGAEGLSMLGGLIASGLIAQTQDGPTWSLWLDGATLTRPPPAHAADEPFQGVPGRSPSDPAQRVRDDRSRFARRLKGWSRVAPGVTWETWLVTNEGAAFVAGREVEYPGYALRARGGHGGVTGGSHPQGSRGVTHGGHGPSRGSDKSSDLKGFVSVEEPQKEDSDARGSRGVTPGGHGPGVTGGHGRGSHLSADDVDGALAVACGKRFEPRCAAQSKLDLVTLLNELEVTRADLPALGRALDPSKLWPWCDSFKSPRARVTVPWLIGKPDAAGKRDAARLTEWVSAARAAGEPDAPRPRNDRAPAAETPEQGAVRVSTFAALRDGLRAQRLTPTPPAPGDTP